jgi:hypothetical protein
VNLECGSLLPLSFRQPGPAPAALSRGERVARCRRFHQPERVG